MFDQDGADFFLEELHAGGVGANGAHQTARRTDASSRNPFRVAIGWVMVSPSGSKAWRAGGVSPLI